MASRRQVLLASALCLVASGALAQARRLPRVGLLHTGNSKESPAIQREPFEKGLRDLGWLPASNVLLEYRYAEGDPAKLRALADELVRLRVDVIVARANAAIGAARKATSTIPIVMSAYTGDPGADGIVNTLSRPGGNVTGISSSPVELDGKRLEMLKEAFPKIKRVGVVTNPALYGGFNAERMHTLEDAARSLGLQLQSLEVHRKEDVAAIFTVVNKAKLDALLVRGDPQVLDANRNEIAALAVKARVPAMYWWPFFVDAGGLMSYGESISGFHYRSASFVSRILKGEKVGDLPIEQPRKFDLIVNVKTARAMGIEIPKAVMFRADRVVE
ncbi:MAG TPA: ABC transporter substrate-binding protein [Burkholderiales bacterium]|nr:ABC transporter substrate-binding protein [Burkholderiales bacterium]